MGILGIIVIILTLCICRKKKEDIKRKLSDDQLTEVEYDPTEDSVRILEGVDPIEQLNRHVLVSRLQAGIERPVEDLGPILDSPDMFDF